MIKEKVLGDEIVQDAKVVYFVQHTVTDERGEYKVCMAVEGEKGYRLTDWTWGKDYKIAEQCADEKNVAMGIDKKTAMRIVLGTMRPLV